MTPPGLSGTGEKPFGVLRERGGSSPLFGRAPLGCPVASAATSIGVPQSIGATVFRAEAVAGWTDRYADACAGQGRPRAPETTLALGPAGRVGGGLVDGH